MNGLTLIETQGVLDALGAILSSLVDGVILFDREARVLLANPAAGRLLGRGAAPLVNERLEDLLQPALMPDQREEVIHVLRERTPHAGLKLDWPAGQVFSVSLTPVWRSPGRLLGMVTVIRDVTREAQLERLKSTFVSMVSHELRTPLVAILSQIELLNLGLLDPLTDPPEAAFDRIAAQAQRLLLVVNDLLDEAQIESGQWLALKPGVFAPAELIANLRAILDELTRTRPLTLAYEVAADLPDRLAGDPQRLLQLLINLAGNAVKFTNQGEVRVTIDRLDADHWRIQVADTGPGIAAGDQARLFEPFQRVGPQGGVGLGLAIVKHLVGLMQGELHLSSVVGEGSVFSVRLPLVKAPTVGGVTPSPLTMDSPAARLWISEPGSRLGAEA
ncbi:two-component system, OmpR family, phosphate regulon sensor histidine kinase PhoR [Planctomycetaceae bacterium]|nr:two-component system, OmpR family, phosphate regulon sensor histidine kinase PhoR [Planctomycetaceae bacterium]